MIVGFCGNGLTYFHSLFAPLRATAWKERTCLSCKALDFYYVCVFVHKRIKCTNNIETV